MNFYETGDNGLWIFLLVTVIMGGAAARATGAALAATWRPTWQIFTVSILLTLAVRFLHYALFYETLLSIPNFVADYLVIVAFCGLGFWMRRVRQMVEQYPWAYERSGYFSWRRRPTLQG